MKALSVKIKKRKQEDGVNVLCQRTKNEKILYGIIFVTFIIYAITLIYPLIYLFMSSLRSPLEYMGVTSGDINPFSFPKKWLFLNYFKILSEMKIPNSTGYRYINLGEMLFNSIWYVFAVTGAGVLMSAFTGYVMSKYRFAGRNIIYAVAIFAMTIPIVGNTGASFKLMSDLGIYNTPWYALITSLGGFGFNFLIMYGFFSNISWSYAEAVFIDGGGHFTVLFKIMLPQAKNAVITLLIVSFIGAWNDYMTPLLYMPDFPTVASGLYKISVTLKRGGDYPLYFAGLVVSVIPVIIIFSCFSNVIMKNMGVGGLKG